MLSDMRLILFIVLANIAYAIFMYFALRGIFV